MRQTVADRLSDKLDEVRDDLGTKINDTSVELAKVTQKMADHVESDTQWFERFDKNFEDLRKDLNEKCLSKSDAKKVSGWTSAVIAIVTTLITACTTILAAG